MSGQKATIADWAQVGSAIVGLVAAAAAAIAGWVTWQQGIRQEEQFKTQQALEFFATFNAPDMLTLRRELSNETWCAWYGYMPTAEYEETYGQPYQQTVKREEILLVVDFFDTVSDCVNEGTCPEGFVNRLFVPYAREFYDDLSGEIKKLREDRGDTFGEGMADLAGRPPEEPIQTVVDEFRNTCG